MMGILIFNIGKHIFMRSNLIYAGSHFWNFFFSFSIGIYLKRIVPPEVIGVFVFVSAVYIIVEIPLAFLRTSLERLGPTYTVGQDTKQNESFFITIFWLTVLFTFIISIFFFMMGYFFSDTMFQSFAFYCFIPFFIMSSFVQLITFIFKGQNILQYSGVFNVIRSLLFFSLLAIFCLISSIKGYYIGYSLGSLIILIICIGLFYLLRKKLYVNFSLTKFSVDSLIIKRILSVGFVLLFCNYLFKFIFSLDRFFIQHYFSSEYLAYYSTALQFVTVVITLGMAFIGSYTPKLFMNFDRKQSNHALINTLLLLSQWGGAFSRY